MLFFANGSNNSYIWIIIGVALITLILGLVGGAIAAYKLIPNNAKKQAENIIAYEVQKIKQNFVLLQLF